MQFATLPPYDAEMPQLRIEPNTPRILSDSPTVCPVCWDHDITRIEDVRLSLDGGDGHKVGRASVYRCGHWHLFALFEQVGD
jgi:hypothetical protein